MPTAEQTQSAGGVQSRSIQRQLTPCRFKGTSLRRPAHQVAVEPYLAPIQGEREGSTIGEFECQGGESGRQCHNVILDDVGGVVGEELTYEFNP